MIHIEPCWASLPLYFEEVTVNETASDKTSSLLTFTVGVMISISSSNSIVDSGESVPSVFLYAVV